MKKKLCTKCNRRRDITRFYKDDSRKDGHTAICIDCRAIRYQLRKAARAADPIRAAVDEEIL